MLDANESYYHCSSEWHLARLTGKGAHTAALIYTFALHIAYNSKTFSASVPRLAVHFSATEATIRKALHLLVDAGLFEVIRVEPGASVCYRPMRHKEDWVPKHPGCCPVRIAQPWLKEEEVDELSVALHAISGHRFKTHANLITGIRNTGHTDQVICEMFRAYTAQVQPTGKEWKNGFASGFIKYLNRQALL